MHDLIHIEVAVPAAKVGALYGMLATLLGSTAAVAVAGAAGVTASPTPSPTPTPSEATAAVAGEAGGAVISGADNGDGTGVDAHGHPWSEALHASTKSQTKEGLWRMKVGVSRPDPLPGFPKTDAAATAGTGTVQSAPAGDTATASTAGPGTVDDEDEFAAFRAAAADSAPANVPARKWTDADLGALCNQAAVKLGDPAPVKEIIGQHVPASETPHSRNIPQDKREAFAKAIEAKADIVFAG